MLAIGQDRESRVLIELIRARVVMRQAQTSSVNSLDFAEWI